MAQLPCNGFYKASINPINPPFGDCAMYSDHGVLTGMILLSIPIVNHLVFAEELFVGVALIGAWNVEELHAGNHLR